MSRPVGEQRGPLHGFRWKDWLDWRSAPGRRPIGPLDQQIGLGDDTTTGFALVKRYGDGTDPYLRPIAKPVAGSVRVGVEGDEMQEGVHYETDATRGDITFFDAPIRGREVTAGFEFDVPVRFDADRIQTSVASFQAGDVPNVPVVEVRV